MSVLVPQWVVHIAHPMHTLWLALQSRVVRLFAPCAASLLASIPSGRGWGTRPHVHPLRAHSCFAMHMDSRSFAYSQSRESRPCRLVVSLRSPPPSPLSRSCSRSSARYVPMPIQPTVNGPHRRFSEHHRSSTAVRSLHCILCITYTHSVTSVPSHPTCSLMTLTNITTYLDPTRLAGYCSHRCA